MINWIIIKFLFFIKRTKILIFFIYVYLLNKINEFKKQKRDQFQS